MKKVLLIGDSIRLNYMPRVYRNLSGVKLNFDKECNFLVGENSIGKSNALDCILTIIEGKNFVLTDYYNSLLPIVVDLEVSYKQHYNSSTRTKEVIRVKQYPNKNIEIDGKGELLKQIKAIYLKEKMRIGEEQILKVIPREDYEGFIKLFNNLDIVKRSYGLFSRPIQNFFSGSGVGSNYSYYILEIILKIMKALVYLK